MVGNLVAKSLLKKTVQAILLAGIGVSLTGCGSFMSSDGELEKSSATPPVAENTFDLSVLQAPAVCPTLQELSGTTILTKYPRGKEKTPENLSYQAIIKDWARTCRRSGTNSAMKLGIAGNITPGPAWKGGEILLPLRVAVTQDVGGEEKTIYSKLFNVPVTLGSGSPSATWAFVEENIILPSERGQSVVFGFDEN
ncbi:hypothetical protein PsAD2_02289 [Pseudovibrio axinellae]|uniref:Lipoprotein n=1 Tax=Pseudovibrio axinellae TaxID=989403 RepID=A0A165YEK2_9HYPH|nr:hypothetical protein [Pseudovibrio axinellae]KZL18774.1 hypothetical protein PsAD2_02289 [Pseudovibrio axinellae]SEP93321.1 hypothetical protein SAMN05421798_101752 [Pseudovibrio axinellae]